MLKSGALRKGSCCERRYINGYTQYNAKDIALYCIALHSFHYKSAMPLIILKTFVHYPCALLVLEPHLQVLVKWLSCSACNVEGTGSKLPTSTKRGDYCAECTLSDSPCSVESVCVRVCVRACVCVCACVRACVGVRVCA